MSDLLPLGVAGVQVKPGDHICAFYVGTEERDQVLLPYLREGLVAGDKVICVVDASEPSEVLARIGPDIDVDRCVASQQFELQPSSEAYLPAGSFSTDAMPSSGTPPSAAPSARGATASPGPWAR